MLITISGVKLLLTLGSVLEASAKVFQSSKLSNGERGRTFYFAVTDKQTDRQTDTLITISCILLGEVK